MSLSTANSAPNLYPGTSISGSNQYLGLRISVRGSFVFPKPGAEPALNRASLGVDATAFVDAAIQQRMAGQNTQMVGRARMRVIG
jgi:hypothetical protein